MFGFLKKEPKPVQPAVPVTEALSPEGAVLPQVKVTRKFSVSREGHGQSQVWFTRCRAFMVSEGYQLW